MWHICRVEYYAVFKNGTYHTMDGLGKLYAERNASKHPMF